MSTKKQGGCTPPNWWLSPNHVAHFCLAKLHVSACGLSNAKIAALDIASVTCKRCIRSRVMKQVMDTPAKKLAFDEPRV